MKKGICFFGNQILVVKVLRNENNPQTLRLERNRYIFDKSKDRLYVQDMGITTVSKLKNISTKKLKKGKICFSFNKSFEGFHKSHQV